jgi:hypothetical protein
MADIDHIAALSDRCFEKRGSLVSLWQEVADNFYPERAEFTTFRSLGTDFAANLVTSFPMLARRDMGDMFASMLRPTDVHWFSIVTNRQDSLSHESKGLLQTWSKTQWNAMYDPAAKFQRATKEGDHDYTTFGQCVISKEFNDTDMAMYYRCWHLRDVAWMEDERGNTCPIFRKEKSTAHKLNKEFKGNISKSVKGMLTDPKRMFDDVDIRHAVVPADMITTKKWRTPYVSVFYEQATKHLLSEVGVWTKVYTIPRWQTVSGSQYAYSPATIAALPDARLIQQMTLVLLEAGEKAVNPPLIATQDVVRTDIHQFAGGTTWVDAEYDERLGEALRPMTINSNGIPHGMAMREDVRKAIEAAFYLDKIGLPQMNGDMTAFETAQRVKEYMRKIVPLFSPIEADYNADLCDGTFELLMRNGAFGPMSEIPDDLKGNDIKFQFRSPLSENLDRQKAQSFQEAKQMLAETIPLDQSVAKMIDIRKALRDTMEGVGVPQIWLRSEEELVAIDEQNAKTAQAQQMMAAMQQGAQIGDTMGSAAKQFAQAGVMQ